jgi:enoyl-CoA hydratase
LAEICSSEGGNGTVKAMVLTGAGDKAFAAGTDIAQFRGFRTEQDVYDYEERMSEVARAVERCAVPTIAAIRGACTGGGAALASCCDLRIGAPSVRFGFPVARTLGNCLSTDNYARLADLIGSSRTKEIIFTARLVGAAEAAQIGWLHEVVADEDQLLPRVEEMARIVGGHAPLTLRATKQALFRIRDGETPADTNDLVRMCYLSDDFKEGIEAFLGKRQPNWQGR